jgi:signal transduction histidine kinase
VLRLIDETSRQPSDSPIARVLREGVAVGLSNRTVLIARSGREWAIEDCAAPIWADDGRLIGAVLVFRDVTERRHLERELQRRAERLADNARRKDAFLAMLAHELRNPLAPLLTGLRVLEVSGAADPEGAAVAVRQMMERQVRHLVRIVDDLLDVSLLTQGRVRLQCERLDLVRLARTAVADRRSRFDQGGLELRVEAPQTPLWVNGDATRLTQILDNLLDNAARFTPRGGRVTVRLEGDAGRKEVRLTVSDTGEGIDPALLPYLFEALAQSDASLDRSRGGLGLGLALVRGLARLHDGDATVTSPGPGAGAELTVRLPLQPEPAALADTPTEAPPLGRLRLLIIEDNRDAADSLQLFLMLLGHEVRATYTGPEGVAAAREWRPEVVLCDIGLPGLDGYGVARELRGDPATAAVRLIAVSGYASEEDRRRSREAGFDHHLVKPADPDVLLRLLA